jgi:hypothetical protein
LSRHVKADEMVPKVVQPGDAQAGRFVLRYAGRIASQ